MDAERSMTQICVETMMTMSSGLRVPGWTIAAIAGFVILVLSGCQHAPQKGAGEAPTVWRVLERVGQVRTAVADRPAPDMPRPGEAIAEGARVTTGRGALLILQKDGVQFTAGEDTSVRLPSSSAASGLFLDHGWLRVRVASGVDREARIETTHFNINTSSTTLTLRTGPKSTDLAIEAGSAVLATADGLHHATLVAGAGARMDQAAGDDLLIRTASGGPFTKVTPLPAEIQHRHDGPEPAQPNADKVRSVTDAPPARAAETVPAGGGLAILPASRLKTAERVSPAAAEPKTAASPASGPDVPRLRLATPSTAAERPSFRSRVVPSSMHDDAVQTDPIPRQAGTFDPLQIRFDRLTEGLVDGL